MADKSKKTEIPMTHPDGRPWTAESEVEAMELMAHGYTRNDAGKKAPAAAGAKTNATKPGDPT